MKKSIIYVSIAILIGILIYQFVYNRTVPLVPINPNPSDTLSFDKSGGFIALRSGEFDARQNYKIAFQFKTANDGLIMTMGGSTVIAPASPYIIVYIQGGILRFIHNGPSGGVALLSSPNVILNNRWHDVAIDKSNNSFSMKIDGVESKYTTVTDPIQNSPIYIGNRPTKEDFPIGTGFIGCLKGITFNDKTNLSYDTIGKVSKSCL